MRSAPPGVMVASLGQVQGLILHAAAGSAPSQVYYFHNDHLGTPQVITDETGAVVWKADYDPFGEANVVVQLIESNFRFPGQWFDEETGLHQNWYRDYAPGLGRYVEPDPALGLPFIIQNQVICVAPLSIESPSHLNIYAYAAENPIVGMDPHGLGPLNWIKCLYYGAKVAQARDRCTKELQREKCERPKYMTEAEVEVRWMAKYGAAFLSGAMKDCTTEKVGAQTYAWWQIHCFRAATHIPRQAL